MKNKILLFTVLILFVGLVYFSYSTFLADNENDSDTLVYETEVDSANDCSSFEKYDEERSVCYFECTDENQCKQIESRIDQELASWTEELENDKEPVAEKTISENDPSLQADYKVERGENLVFSNGSDKDEYRKIWTEVAVLSPDDLSDKFIEEFQIFNNPSDDTLAFVDDEDNNGKWRVAVNLSGYKTSTVRENKATFIHELGHIISLNTNQLEQSENCVNFKLEEGCARTSSYINQFKNNFWKGVSQQEFSEEKFVTEYATTNEVEDLAESFAFFVLGNKPSDNSVKSQKQNFFYNFSDLVKIRQDMRSALSREIVLSEKNK